MRSIRVVPRIAWLAAALLSLGTPALILAQRPPVIAAAANLNFALTEVGETFARERGMHVNLVFGASGTLARQIEDGAPFEMFLAADEEFPARLTAAGGRATPVRSTRWAAWLSMLPPGRR